MKRFLLFGLLTFSGYLPSITLAADIIETYKVPADFPWESYDEYENCLFEHTGGLQLLDQAVVPNSTDVVAIASVIAFGRQVYKFVLGGIALANAIDGCVQNYKDPTPTRQFQCIAGIAGTAGAIGGSSSAIKKYASTVKGWFEKGIDAWSGSGLENIDPSVFQKRDFADDASRDAQHMHNAVMFHAIRDIAPNVQFLGYAHDGHRLSRRESTVHPYAPVFRFNHSGLPPMDVVSRDLGEEAGGTHYTIAYAGHATHLKRDVYFRHERLKAHVLEARFSEAASRADTHSISFSASAAFNKLSSHIECFLGGEWPAGHVLNMQFYDKTHQETFAFGSVGIFGDTSHNSAFANSFSPTGQPLTGGENC